MRIYLPHIDYTVTVRQTLKEPPIQGALAYVKSTSKHGCTLYIDKRKRIEPGDLAHELVHVLQFICLNRNIDFICEQEHMAYIMHYLMGRILRKKWSRS